MAEFFGRAREIDAIVAALRASPVVTVTGPGGVGKTATALRAAAAYADATGAAVRVVELAALEPGDVDAAIDTAWAEDVRPLLLLLDNAEHVVPVARAWIDREERADTAILATSRAPLCVKDERLVALDVLPEADAVALFVDRANLAGVRLVDESAVGALCARLDRLPLAIELAAARSRVLSPSAIAEKLAHDWSVVRTTASATPAHHASLDATIAWSFDLLDDTDRANLLRLSAFADRFDLAQAERVGVDVDALERLVHHSLVVAEPAHDTPYRLLDAVRAFASAQPSEDHRIARDGIVDWLLEVTAAVETAAADQVALHARLDRSPGDVRRAIEDATRTRAADAVTLVGRLGAWFWDGNRAHDGLELATAVLAADTGRDPLATARLLNAIANLTVRTGEPQRAVPLYERALTLRIEHGAGIQQIGSTRNDLGACLMHAGDLGAAAQVLEQARADYASGGDRWGVATATTNLAAVRVTAGQTDGAAAAFHDAAAEFLALGDAAHAAAARTNEGLVLLEVDDDRAGDTLALAVRELIRTRVRAVLAPAVAGAATFALRRGDSERGAQLFGAAIAAGPVDVDLRAEFEDALGLIRAGELIAAGGALSDDDIVALADRRERAVAAASSATFERAGRGWRVTFDGRSVDIPGLKGFTYLAHLLAAAGREIHVEELAGGQVRQKGTEVIDDAALTAYRERVAQLQRALEAADRRGDESAGIEAQAELDQLMTEIRHSTGRGGRIRVENDNTERARKAVTNRVRDAIRALADVHPALARHLEHSVETGTFCRYAPEHPVAWSVQT